MIRKLQGLCLFLLFSALARGHAVDLCELQNGLPTQVTQIPTYPISNYYFNVHPKLPLVGMVAKSIVGDERSYAQIFQLQTGQSRYVLGNGDLFFSPDGRIVSLPYRISDDKPLDIGPRHPFSTWAKKKRFKEGMYFYLLQDIYHKGQFTNAPPRILLLDAAASGDYQSIGILKEDAKEITYRMLVDQEGASFRDYIFNKTNKTLKPKGNLKPLCPKRFQRHENEFHLPMLDASGHFFSSYSTKTQSSHIFSIDSKGHCQHLFDLRGLTSKVFFDTKNHRLSFYLQRLKPGPRKHLVFYHDVYVLQMNKDWNKALGVAKLTHNKTPGFLNYYPQFNQQGDVFVHQILPTKTFSIQHQQKSYPFPLAQHQFLWYKSDQLRFVPLDQNLLTLEQLYIKNCPKSSSFPAPPKQQFHYLSLALSPEHCRELVHKKALNTQKKALTKVCKQLGIKKPKRFTTQGHWLDFKKLKFSPQAKAGFVLFQKYCLHCHQQIDEDFLNTYPMRLESQDPKLKMPPQKRLTAKQLKQIKSYLRDLAQNNYLQDH